MISSHKNHNSSFYDSELIQMHSVLHALTTLIKSSFLMKANISVQPVHTALLQMFFFFFVIEISYLVNCMLGIIS